MTISTSTSNPIVTQPPPAHAPLVSPVTKALATEIVAVISMVVTLGIAYFSRNLSEKVRSLSTKIDKKEEELVPPAEVARIREILAQLAIITDADRVTLGVLHNGVIGAKGAHYDKVKILAGYSAPGVLPLPELYKDVKADNLMEDLMPLLGQQGSLQLSKKTAPANCALYMSRRDISNLRNMLLTSGNIDIAVLSFHWCSSAHEEEAFPPTGSRGDGRFNDLISEILYIIQASKDRKRILG